jgi:putative ABC transport system permease protein
MQGLWQDLRFAWRACQRERATTLLAVALVGASIGANVATLSAVRAVIMRPLPYASADRLVTVRERHPAKGLEDQLLSPARYLEWQESRDLFEEVAAYDSMEQNLTGMGLPDRVHVARLSSSLFGLTGATPVRGRAFAAADERADAPAAAIVSHELWQGRMAGAVPDGHTLRLDESVFQVVGVMPKWFALPKADVYIPLSLPFRNSRVSRHLQVIGRLAEGLDLPAARERAGQISARMEAAHPSTDAGWTTTLTPLRDATVGEAKAALAILMGAVGLVLLITCATVANLLLARAIGHTRDVAVRLVLGAPRIRVLRQLLAEILLIVGAGGVVGLLMAAWLVEAFRALPFARFDEIGIDATVMALAATLVMLTAVSVGTAPTLAVWRRDLAKTLGTGGRDRTSDRLRRRIGGVVVVFQVAAAVSLTVGAGLLVTSLRNLMNVDPGFQPAGVLTGRLSFPRVRYRSAADLRQFERALVEQVSSVPGVVSTGTVNVLPFAGRRVPFNVALEGRPANGHAQLLSADIRVASPEYFATIGIPLVSGRGLEPGDTAEARQVVVVNATMARRFWPERSPMGQRLSLDGSDGPWITVVGVVGDVRHTGSATDPLREMYIPFAQHTWPSLTLVVRTRTNPQSLAKTLRETVARLDPELPLFDVRPLDEIVGSSLMRQRLLSVLFAAFSITALTLALAGIFGVMSQMVAQRRAEMGVRMALGAEPGQVLFLIVREGIWLVAAGITVGLVAAWLLSGALSSVLFGVGPGAPEVFILSAALVLGAGLLACYIPARHASGLNPAAVLRDL